MCCSRKHPSPLTEGIEIPEGWGAQEIPERRKCEWLLLVSRHETSHSCFKIETYLRRSFLKTLLCLTILQKLLLHCYNVPFLFSEMPWEAK